MKEGDPVLKAITDGGGERRGFDPVEMESERASSRRQRLRRVLEVEQYFDQ